jgi:hypothetical protein
MIAIRVNLPIRLRSPRKVRELRRDLAEAACILTPAKAGQTHPPNLPHLPYLPYLPIYQS